ncbi:hypothetical protein BKA65DRAFT_411224, partial [Rhexocercosporidium sp. MPI-PUGE-AT-0058]
GLFAQSDIAKDEVIVEYKGKVISKAQYNRKPQKKCRYVYALRKVHFGKELFIDANEAKFGKARFANHSCSPNCRMEEWHVNGFIRVVLVAQKDISAAAKEPLAFDYLDIIILFEPFCRYRSESCRLPPPKDRSDGQLLMTINLDT